MKSPPTKATSDLVDMAKEALKEMPPLEAGRFLRDLGCNFPVTMDAVRKAQKILGISTRILTARPSIIEIGSASGFPRSLCQKAKKLEIIQNSKQQRCVLRGDFNKILAQTVQERR